MALGTFSGGGLGMGVAFVLEDYFSKTADTIERKMGQLGNYTDVMANKIDRAMDKIKMGTAVAVAGGLILAPFIKGLAAASDLEENINKVDVAFGKYADRIKNFSDTSIDNFGIDKVKALEMTALYGDMATGMGMNQNEAAAMSEQMTALVGDIASFKNISQDDAMNKLSAVFDGQSRKLLSLGIVMDQATLNAYGLSKGMKSLEDMDDVEKAQLRFKFILDRSRNAIGDYVRTADGYANSKRTMQGMLYQVSATIGSVLLPVASKIFQVFTGLLKVFDGFAKTSFGKFILGSVAALGGFLVVLGLSLVLMGGARFSLYKLTSAFGAKTKATLIATIAEHGFAAGLRAVGKAAWLSLGPYALVVAAIFAVVYAVKKGIEWMDKGTETTARWGTYLLSILGPIGWVIAGIVGIRRGFRDLATWDGVSETSGVLGFFMKVAAVIEAVGQIWDSFNGDTFSMSKSLNDKLKALGLLDFVVQLGRWISRLKTIFNGVVDGFKKGFSILSERFKVIRDRLNQTFVRVGGVIGRVWGRIKKAIQPLIDIFHKITNGIFQNMGSLMTWQRVADYITTAIVIGFEFIAVIIETIINIIASAIEIFFYLLDAVTYVFSAIYDGVGTMFSAGVNMAKNLWEGIKSIWSSLTTWIDDKISALFEKLQAPFKWLGNKMGAAWNWATGGDDEETTPYGGDGLPNTPDINPPKMNHTNTTKSPMVVTNNTNTKEATNGGTIILQTVLDSEVISEKVIDKQKMDLARE